MIVGKIDVTKISKDRLFAGKNGAKYLDFVMIETPDNRYGDSHMICESISKEERAAGKKGAILGNAKIIGESSAKPAKPKREEKPADPEADDDIPF